MQQWSPRALFVALAVVCAPTAFADEYTNSAQLARIKVDAAIQSAGLYGKGIKIAIVDTGVNASHSELAGRVLAQSTCTASGNCANGFKDTNFHGTFVASIAAGALNNTGMVGVAPQASILAVKIAQANGSAYLNDLNAGLVKAGQLGAHVINLSYTSFMGPAQTPYYATYNNSLVNAINTATANGATVVIAGGNDNRIFMANLNQAGFTANALKHMIFVGSVNSTNGLSSFSNTPGSTRFSAPTGQNVTLGSMWLMAPGENLIGAAYSNNNGYYQASGTSFSAPQISGAVALLDARWPVLFRNGTTASVLLATAKDLGTAGVDTVFGAGLADLNKAFLPVGNLNIPNAKGAQVNVSTINGSMLSSGAFGALNSIKASLANINAFDTYGRDFSVNLSTLIATKPTAATVKLPHGVQVVGSAYKLTDGSTYTRAENVSTLPIAAQSKIPGQRQSYFASFTDSEGNVSSGGYGFPASASFANALWGTNAIETAAVQSINASNALMDYASGGMFSARGWNLGADTRMAVLWAETNNDNDITKNTTARAENATVLGIGLSHNVTDTWSVGTTVNMLTEENQWLGSTYGNSPIQFGQDHRSLSVGVSTSLRTSAQSALVFDAAVARSNGSDVSEGLISNVSDVYARSYGVSFVQNNAFKKGDSLSIGVKKPLKVFKGDATLDKTYVDEYGYSKIIGEKTSLNPDGSETDFNIDYNRAFNEKISASLTFTARQDADNISNQSDAGIVARMKFAF